MSSFVLAAEIGGTKLQVAIGTRQGAIMHRERGSASVAGGARAILEWFATAVPRSLDHARGLNASIESIGVGFGGPIETATGRVLVSHQVAGWDGIPLKQWFEDAFHLPTSVSNDSNAAGWAEYVLGSGRGARHFAYMNIGSGIGGAFVIDGKLYDGQGFGAAEIGHTHVPDWTSTQPGAVDKLEHLCSGWAMERRVRASVRLSPDSPLYSLCNGDRESITSAMIGEAASAGDATAIAAIDQIAESIGIALANVLTLFHPERIAIGGGVSLMGDVLFDRIRRAVDGRVFGPYRGRYEITPCLLSEDVVIAGGLLLAP